MLSVASCRLSSSLRSALQRPAGLMLDKDRWRPPSQNRSFAVPEVGRVAQPDGASVFEAEGCGFAMPRSPAQPKEKRPGGRFVMETRGGRLGACAGSHQRSKLTNVPQVV